MYTGLTGALKITQEIGGVCVQPPKTIAYISGWSIEDKTEVIETTRIDRTHKETLPGFQSWSASADGAIVFEDDNGQEDLFKTKYTGGKVQIEFYLLDNAIAPDGNGTYFTGEGYIESLSVDLSAGDKGNISISIKGTGSLDLIVEGKKSVEYEYFGFKIIGDDLYLMVPDGMTQNAQYDETTGEVIINL